MNACLVSLLLSGGWAAGQVPAPPVIVMPAPVVRPIGVDDFARSFVPLPGKHQVLFYHPVSGKPVLVCFTLPPGCPKVCVHKRTLKFDYGKCAVTIHFQLFHSKVKVRDS